MADIIGFCVLFMKKKNRLCFDFGVVLVVDVCVCFVIMRWEFFHVMCYFALFFPRCLAVIISILRCVFFSGGVPAAGGGGKHNITIERQFGIWYCCGGGSGSGGAPAAG